jgi:hypothetical protein
MIDMRLFPKSPARDSNIFAAPTISQHCVEGGPSNSIFMFTGRAENYVVGQKRKPITESVNAIWPRNFYQARLAPNATTGFWSPLQTSTIRQDNAEVQWINSNMESSEKKGASVNKKAHKAWNSRASGTEGRERLCRRCSLWKHWYPRTPCEARQITDSEGGAWTCVDSTGTAFKCRSGHAAVCW